MATTIGLVWFLFGDDRTKYKPHGQGDEPSAPGSPLDIWRLKSLSLQNSSLSLFRSRPRLQLMVIAWRGHIPLGEYAGGDKGFMSTMFLGASTHGLVNAHCKRPLAWH